VSEQEQAAELAIRLKAAHARVRGLDADSEVKARVTRRLLALTDASKHDVAHASARLGALLADLDAGQPGTGG